MVGLYLLCLAGRDTLSLTGGEWQLLLCAALFTLQIMLVNHFSPQLDGIQLSFMQFLVVAVLSTVFMFAFETPTIEQFRGAAVSIAYCGIMSSGVAYTLQIVGQKELDPTIASLCHVPGECVQRPGRLADFGRDAVRHRVIAAAF